MHFEAEQLTTILARQTQPVLVRRADGSEWRHLPGSDAAYLSAGGGFYGVGHRRRVRFIREHRQAARERRAKWAAMDRYVNWAKNRTGTDIVEATPTIGDNYV